MRTTTTTATRVGACVTVAMTALCAAARAQTKSPEEEHFYMSEQLVHDDNLFRVPRAGAPDGDTHAIASRDDQINRLTLGIGDDMHFGRQILRAKGRVQDVRFQQNDHLDHTAGNALLAYEWRLLGSWSGTLSAGYDRMLADFANLRSTAQDLVETAAYSGSARYEIGPRWALSAHGRRTRTEHSLDLRRSDEVEAELGRLALTYTTPSEHEVGVEYRYTRAEFPNHLPGLADAHSPHYDESAALARVSYTASVRTRLEAIFGYVERTHPQGSGNGDYSGDTWRATIDWHPREKFSTTLSAWHELKAYVDAESDYFVSDGFSIAPQWRPLRSISLDVRLSLEEQDYIGTSLLPEETARRNDEVLTALATFSYSPRPNLQLQLTYLLSDRDSNRDWRRYDAQVAGASIRWRVM